MRPGEPPSPLAVSPPNRRPADAGSVERASAEYLRKYASSEYAPAMAVEGVLGTTLRLEPA